MKSKLVGITLVALTLMLTSIALKADDKKVTLKGYLMDKMCSTGAMKNADPMAKAKGHTKECAMMKDCAASGYGIISDGKFYAFDKNGNDLASKWLETTAKTKELSIEVTGTPQPDGSLMVESLKDAE